jgi:hypothetical protein
LPVQIGKYLVMARRMRNFVEHDVLGHGRKSGQAAVWAANNPEWKLGSSDIGFRCVFP